MSKGLPASGGGEGRSHPGHIPVLLKESIDALSLEPGQTYVDCTTGLGGHALEAGRLVGRGGTLILCDLDEVNLRDAADRIRRELGEGCPRIVESPGNFATLPRRMLEMGMKGDAVLADLGFASSQMEDSSRGFSFMRDGPLDMRLARRVEGGEGRGEAMPATAAELLASISEAELVSLLREFGEERHARSIARKLAERRREHPIQTTSELACLVRAASGPHDSSGIDPATRTFQALRIAVNDELGNLDALLHAARGGLLDRPRPDWLARGARVGVISFHSLEDRPVKAMFARIVSEGLGTSITDGPITPSAHEVLVNPRSRSAKLRAVRGR